MKKTWWKSGQWNALCDECGFKFKSPDLKKRWDGLMVCADCYEIRHPQELLRPVPDQSKLPWTRPEARDSFVPPVCTLAGLNGLAGIGTAGCAVLGYDNGARALIDITHNA